jgi:hypothetical protein
MRIQVQVLSQYCENKLSWYVSENDELTTSSEHIHAC